MASIDKKIRDLDITQALQFLKRFLDDYFLIFIGSTKKFHALIVEINKINPTIKLTMNHTQIEHENIEDKCDCKPIQAIPFLDTLCSIKDGKIDIDLYKKDTDRNQYLLPSSCHPAQTKKAIPFSLGLRIVRTCTDSKNRDIKLKELKNMLIDREYSETLIDTAIKGQKEYQGK